MMYIISNTQCADTSLYIAVSRFPVYIAFCRCEAILDYCSA